MSAQVLICCGSGGVGKTTVSAAVAVRLALAGKRVAVLTIDPARRLADSLDIGALDNSPRQVPLEHLEPAPGGRLDAMMLDAKTTFDDMVRRLARSEESARRILEHRYYRFASTRLGGSHEYMAMERLTSLWEGGEYDVIVLDTPPTRHALDFLEAPRRMSGLMDQGVLRWLVMPASSGGWRAIELGSEVVARALKRVMGQGTVGEIADFFEVFRDLWDGFRDRSVKVDALLHRDSTRFLLVTTPASTSRADALFFLQVLLERGLPFGGFVLNRVVTAPEHELGRDEIPDLPLPDDRSAALTRALVQAPALQRQLAEDHEASIAELLAAAPGSRRIWRVPEQDRELHDLAGLASLAPFLEGVESAS